MQALKPRTADEAVGRWPGILQSLGVDAAFLSKKHGPCPICSARLSGALNVMFYLQNL